MRFSLTACVFAIAAMAFASLPAEAHGPPRKKVVSTVKIAAPPAKAWAVIGNFHEMGWHPAVDSTSGSGGNEPGAKRVITLKGGGTLNEELEKFDATAMTYTYRITDVDVNVLPVTNYASTIVVTPDGDGSQVEWRGAFYRGYPNNDPPPELNDDAAIRAVTGVYESGLGGLKALLERSP